uniref:Reverse transcriptase domain-containing protein n=1 Tax=Trichuris muris TaxID=70415 RepID=A0A5S6Q4E3_TRIMR
MNDVDKAVVNLSFTVLSSVEIVRSKGLSFVPTPREPPILDRVSSVDHSLSWTEPMKAAEIKGAISGSLMHRYRVTPNINNLERKVMKNLRDKKDLMVTKADKGNVVVLLNREEYITKINRLLDSEVYRPLTSDPTSGTRKVALLLLRCFAEETKDKTLSKIAQKLHFVSNSKCPELYGLPKIHKPEIPLRPVICSTKSMTSDLCCYLKSIIQPLTGNRVSHVSNHKDFCSALKTLTIARNHAMVSCDVKNLFTSIPMAHTLSTLQRLLNSDSTLHQRTSLNPFRIVKLVSFCMNEGNFFRFQDTFYAQTNGAPMGRSLSPVLAEVFMEEFEEMALNKDSCPVAPVLFKRYVDDCFAILEEGEDITLLQHLNSIFPGKITLTMEEVKNSLPFLDVLVQKEGRKLTTMVYGKPTHSDRYLHFTSHQPLSVNRGIATGMIDRASTICDPKHLGTELNHIVKALQKIGT